MTTGGAPRVKSADRTVELLELLAVSPERRTLVDIARDLDIPKSSMHGLLRTLVRRGWVETDSAGLRYGLGVQALRIGTAYLRTDRSVRRLTPVVDRLHRELGATVQLGRLTGDQVICLVSREKAEATPSVGAGLYAPAHATALGRAVLARITLGSPPAETPPNGPSPDDLAQTRARGYAVDWVPVGTASCCSVAVAAPPKLGPHDAIAVSVAVRRLTAPRARDIAEAIMSAVAAGLVADNYVAAPH
ncbi:IclR family transcriptional regulator [Micromonospora sp. 067-2]|uniref:IclR family transcriptional regulator n=1 Tax=Micromonospora sp. 067-2 TaxID=2789270 RepID=UPI003979F965